MYYNYRMQQKYGNNFEPICYSELTEFNTAQNYNRLNHSERRPFLGKCATNFCIKVENDSEAISNNKSPTEDNDLKSNSFGALEDDRIHCIKKEYSAEANDQSYSEDEEDDVCDTNLAIQTNIKCVLEEEEEEEEDEEDEDQSKMRAQVIRRSLCEISDDSQSLRFKTADCRYSLNPLRKDVEEYSGKSMAPTDDRGTGNLSIGHSFAIAETTAKNGLKSNTTVHIG